MATATPESVQKHIDNAVASMKFATISLPIYIRKHGPDWTKWNKKDRWYKVMSEINEARKEAGQLTVKKLHADFAIK